VSVLSIGSFASSTSILSAASKRGLMSWRYYGRPAHVERP
jgi:hypothetical protein